jgi:hypothetical protein
MKVKFTDDNTLKIIRDFFTNQKTALVFYSRLFDRLNAAPEDDLEEYKIACVIGVRFGGNGIFYDGFNESNKTYSYIFKPNHIKQLIYLIFKFEHLRLVNFLITANHPLSCLHSHVTVPLVFVKNDKILHISIETNAEYIFRSVYKYIPHLTKNLTGVVYYNFYKDIIKLNLKRRRKKQNLIGDAAVNIPLTPLIEPLFVGYLSHN